MNALLGFAGVGLLIAGLIYVIARQENKRGSDRARLDAAEAVFDQLRKARGVETNLDKLNPGAKRQRLRDWSRS